MRFNALDKYFESLRTSEFVFGTHDCFLFAAGAVKAVTGRDLLEGVPAYGCETSAVIVLNERWGSCDLREVFLKICAEAGAEKVEPGQMTEGDIVCIKWPTRLHRPGEIIQNTGLGVIYQGEAWAATPYGVMPVNMRLPIIDAWRFK